MGFKKIIARTILGSLCVTGIAVTTASCNGAKIENVEKLEFTITFNTNGGTNVASIKVTEGEKATKPADPTKENYDFAGWYKDEALTTPFDFTTEVISGNLTLYAKWTEKAVVNTYTVTFNTNGGSQVNSVTVEEGKTITKPTDPTKENYDFAGWYKDEALTTPFDFTTEVISGNLTLYAKWTEKAVVNTYTVTFNTNGGSQVNSVTVEEGKAVAKPTDPTKDGFKFVGWYIDEAFSDVYDFATPVNGNLTLYAKWEENASLEVVTRELDCSTLPAGMTDNTKLPGGESVVVGFFTVWGSTKYESSNKAFNTQGSVALHQSGIEFTTTSVGTFKAEIKNASGNNKAYVLLKDGNPYKRVDLAENATATVEFELDGAGTYSFGGEGGSIRIYQMSYTEEVEASSPKEITVKSLPTVDFLEGSTFDFAGLTVELAYENGRTEVISNYNVDNSNVNMSKGGSYEVTISANIEGNDFTTSYTVNVYEATKLNVADHKLDNNRETKVLQEIFLKDGTFNTNNLVVTCTATVPGTDLTKEFVLSNEQYLVTAPDLTTLGEKTVLITSNFGSKTNDKAISTEDYKINVVENVLDMDANLVNVYVNSELSVGVQEGKMTFATLNQALQYLELCGLDESVEKVINLAKGEYFEKVEITLPNVTLKGSTDDAKNPTTETIIIYDAYNALIDPSGLTSYSTDGSATVSIRETATNFKAYNITFKNYWCTNELYNELKAKVSGTQSVAVLVQADKALFENVRFVGYHDTLYAMEGRHYFENCYIEGRTDYIFGYDATSYFTNCEIHTLGSGADDKNGGYIVAAKGDANLTYGYIFNECNFTADENTRDGSTSLARGWDEYMTMMVMNSTLGKHISKEAYGDSTETNDRYGKMNAEPDASRLLEYNNTGDGAITSSLTNTCTVVTEEVANNYKNLVTVFGKDSYKYQDDWTAGKVPYDSTINYYDNDTLLTTKKDYIGTTIDALYVPEKEGFTFVGWYTEKTLENEYSSDSKLTADTLNLYAKWTENADVEVINHTLDVNSVPQLASGLTPVDDFYSVNNKVKTESVKIDGASYDGVVFERQISLTGGKASLTDNAIIFTIAEGSTSVITVYAAEKSDKNVKLSVLDGNGNSVNPENLTINDEVATEFRELSKTTVEKFEFTLSTPGTYYLGGNGGGAYIYGLNVAVKTIS